MCAPAKARPWATWPACCAIGRCWRHLSNENSGSQSPALPMVLTVVKYGAPVLRQKGARIEAVTPTIKKLIADMLETMYASKGIGLAAQQVGLALQLTV